MATLTLLEVTEEAVTLAQELLTTGAVPEKAAEDALHLAIAVTNGVEYLVDLELQTSRERHHADEN